VAEAAPARRAKAAGRKRKSPDESMPTAGKASPSMLNGDTSAGKAGLASLLNSKNIGSRWLAFMSPHLWYTQYVLFVCVIYGGRRRLWTCR